MPLEFLYLIWALANNKLGEKNPPVCFHKPINKMRITSNGFLGLDLRKKKYFLIDFFNVGPFKNNGSKKMNKTEGKKKEKKGKKWVTTRRYINGCN